MSQKVYYPLTSPQLSIWYTEQMFPGTSISNVAGTLRIKEHVDFGLLEKAIQLCIKNNDGMRLRLCLDNHGNPQQYVSEYMEKPVPFIDFGVYEDPEKAFYDWNSKMTLKPFELLNQELFSFTMVKINDTDGGFYIIFHHLISDAWNMSLLGSIIVDYYCKLKNGLTDESAYLPKPSYVSFIESDKAYKCSNRYERDKLFWEQKFDTIPEATVLKTRKTSLPTAKSKRKTFVAPAKFTSKLKEYCREYKVTPYPLFLSALYTYIFRVTAKLDIVLGTPILNRLNHSEKNTAGMFISTIPLRVNINAEENFLELCERVLDVCSAAYRHQRFPYDQILRFVREKHDIKENLYDIVLSYQNAKFDKSYDVNYSTRWLFSGYQPNSLTIHINDRDDEGAIIIDYDYHEDLYYDKEIEFLHQHYLSLLWHALDNPQKMICKIEMLPENEKKKVLYDFNQTEMEYPREKLIHQLFEEQVERTPDNVAVIFEDKSMTYRELNERANQLAHVLRRKGVQRDDIVGIMVPRSFELMIGILAILKAGGAFMTIEPDYPIDRIRYMLENSKSSILLVKGSASCSNILLHTIDTVDIETSEFEDKANLSLINKANDLVYIMYTSGSTGLPKGVMIEHKSLHNLLFCLSKTIRYTENDKVLVHSSISFDVFILETMPTLLYGSALVLTNSIEHKLPCELKRIIKEQKISIAFFTPTKIKLLFSKNNEDDYLSSLRYLMLGGEALDHKLLSNIQKHTGAKITNAYGPTEATITTTCKELADPGRITIGKPLYNITTYILDKYLNLVPIGVIGELYIAGEGLARGYLNEKLTKEAFVPSPFNINDKMYKTGDLVKWSSMGEIDFIGRNDKQVKMKGYRIELKEIEEVMLEFDGVTDVSVQKVDDCLCAYFVSIKEVMISEYRRFLSTKLPRYMIPKYIIRVESMQMTENEKKKIAVFEEFDKYNKRKIEKPANEIEKKLYNILTRLLKLQNIGVDENIFEFGADSLTVIELISFLDKENYILNVNDIYQYPSIRDMSKRILIKTIEANAIPHFNRDQTEQLIRQIENGDLPQLDAAAFGYMPDYMNYHLDNLETGILYQYIKTSLGNIGVFALPIRNIELYSRKDRLLSICGSTINKLKNLGVRVVSLTGLIPSATNYGLDILSTVNNGIQITTGHATTVASMVLSLERLLNECDRDIQNENIAIIGIGSIGSAFSETLLMLYPKIERLVLCDIYEKRDSLQRFKGRLASKYNSKIEILFSTAKELPESFYDATLVIGATNVKDVVDVKKLKPGTLLLDDSSPHCFSEEHAIKRLKSTADILFTEGGILESEEEMEKSTLKLANVFESNFNRHFNHKKEITGCILSSLLTDKCCELTATLDKVDSMECIKHYHKLKEYGFKGARIQLSDYEIPQELIDSYLRRCKNG